MSGTISVLIPTFNRPLLVQEAIDSVLSQQCGAKLEIIVLDDGSTADTREALRRYGEKIRYARQENAGLNAARNHALRLATGDCIALLDDDDVWLPGRLERQLQALQLFPDAGFVHSNFFIWKPPAQRRAQGLQTWYPQTYSWSQLYARRESLPASEPGRPPTTVYCGDLYFWSLFAPMVLPSTALMRRAALGTDVRFPEHDSTCGDWDFFARLSHLHGAVFLPEELVLNRSHEDPWRLTRIDSGIQLRRRIAMIRRLWRKDPQFVQQHSNELDEVELLCLRKLAKHLWAQGAIAEAREATREMSSLSGAPRESADRLLSWLVSVPGSASLAWLLRTYRQRRAGS